MSNKRGTSKRKLTHHMQSSTESTQNDQQSNPNWKKCKTNGELIDTIENHLGGPKLQELRTNLNNVKTVFDNSNKKKWKKKKSIKGQTIPIYQENYALLYSLFDLVETVKSLSANTEILANRQKGGDQQSNPNWKKCKTNGELIDTIENHLGGPKILELRTNLNNVKTVFDNSNKKKWKKKKSIKGQTIPIYQENYALLYSLFDLVETVKSFSANTEILANRQKDGEIGNLRHENNELKEYQKKLTIDNNTKLQEANKEIDKLNNKLSELQSKLEQAEQGKADFQAKLQKANKETDKLNNKLSELQSKLGQAEQGKVDFQAQLQIANKETDKLNNKLSELQSKLGQAEQGKADFQAQLVFEANSHKQEVNGLKKIRDDQKNEIANLNEAYQVTSEDLKQQRKHFQELVKKKDEECQQLANDHSAMKINLKEKDKHIQDISLKLAAEMSTKLSADERAVENVSIKNRPMNVAEEYQMVCSNQWLDAKGAIDEFVKDVPDYQKLQLLCCIIEISERETKLILNEIYTSLQTQMFDPINFVMGKQTPKVVGAHGSSVDRQPDKQSTLCKEKQLPTEMSNIFGDQLKLGSDKVDLFKLIQHIHSTLDKLNEGSSDGHLKHIWNKSKETPNMQEYLSSVIRIVWKMVIQRPPMEFKFTDTFLGEKFQEVFWNSDSVKDPVVINVFPMLHHGKSLMAKGKVLLLDPKKQNTEKVEVYRL